MLQTQTFTNNDFSEIKHPNGDNGLKILIKKRPAPKTENNLNNMIYKVDNQSFNTIEEDMKM